MYKFLYALEYSFWFLILHVVWNQEFLICPFTNNILIWPTCFRFSRFKTSCKRIILNINLFLYIHNSNIFKLELIKLLERGFSLYITSIDIIQHFQMPTKSGKGSIICVESLGKYEDYYPKNWVSTFFLFHLHVVSASF